MPAAITTASVVATPGPSLTREQWAEQSIRDHTDWDSLIADHLAVLQQLGLIEPAPSSFELACREADRRRR
jgi:hypothetical protein